MITQREVDVLLSVAQLYLQALDDDPDNKKLTLPEALMVTELRDTVAKLSGDLFHPGQFTVDCHPTGGMTMRCHVCPDENVGYPFCFVVQNLMGFQSLGELIRLAKEHHDRHHQGRVRPTQTGN